MQRIKLFIPLLIFAILAIFLGIGLQKESDELPSVLLGKPVPNFELSSLEHPEKIFNQDSFKGKPYLLNIWYSWCPACRAEHAYLLKLSSMGIPIVGLNYRDEPEDALEVLNKAGNPYIGNIADTDGKLALDLGVYGSPETYIVDAEGIIRYRLVGVINEEKWLNTLAPIFFNL